MGELATRVGSRKMDSLSRLELFAVNCTGPCALTNWLAGMQFLFQPTLKGGPL